MTNAALPLSRQNLKNFAVEMPAAFTLYCATHDSQTQYAVFNQRLPTLYFCRHLR
jgi:hypothetical protein